ncbi:hypothetical protein DH2020_016390 [Rehmannia glutinosa]|uniref:Nitrate regulatory gene2 protein-like n=1 Tax=Rehmannia glutinosa TaxID=99300 RepID=A0ABR0WNU5_REHGL
MGCTQSKIENEETVNRCKERKQHMERAVTARNKFAAAHSAHAMSLKNTGAALSDFAQGEVIYPSAAAAVASVASSSANKHSDPIIEEENEEDVETESNHSLKRRSKSGGRGGVSAPEVIEDEVLHQPRKNDQRDRGQQRPPPPPENSTWDYFFSMENVPGPTLAEVDENNVEREEIERKMLDERARRREMDGKSEKAEKVAEVVETVSDLPPQPPPPEAAMAAAKVVKRVKQGVPAEAKKKSGGSNVNLLQIFVDLDDCFLKASESAHDVSRMLEATRLHYHSNFADKRGNINHSERVMRVITWNRSFRGLSHADDGADDFDSEEHETHATVLDKMLAWEKKLYDEVKAGEQMKLEYQKKVASLNKLKKRGSNTEALEKMKAAVSHLHTRYIVDMQSMDSTVSEINRLRDDQLYPKLVALVDGTQQLAEAKSRPDRHKLEGKVSSPGRPQNPPIQMILHAWHDYLEKLPDEPAKATINNFAAIIKTIWQYQKEELEFKNKCGESRKELIRKTRDFENWVNKFMQKRTPPDDMDPDRARDEDHIAERRLVVEAAKQKLEEDEEAYQKLCIQVREKSLMSLKSHLPELFRALSDFSLASSDMYSYLRSIAHSRSRNEV